MGGGYFTSKIYIVIKGLGSLEEERLELNESNGNLLDLKLRSNGSFELFAIPKKRQNSLGTMLLVVPGASPKGRSSWDEYGHASLLQRGAALRGKLPVTQTSAGTFHSSRPNTDGKTSGRRAATARQRRQGCSRSPVRSRTAACSVPRASVKCTDCSPL